MKAPVQESKNKTDVLAPEVLLDLASKERDEGHAKAALELMRQCVARTKEAYGESDDRTLKATREMISLMKVLDLGQEALSVCERMLIVCKEVYGEDDQRSLDSMTDVAQLLRRLGRDKEASYLIRQGLAIRSQFIQEHGHNIEQMDKTMLARVFGMACDMAYQAAVEVPKEEYEVARSDALAAMHEVMTLFEKVLGAEDEKTFDVLDEMVNSLIWDNQREETIALRQRILTLRKKVCGEADARTIKSMEQMAEDFESWLCVPEKALPIRKKLLTIKKRQVREFQRDYGKDDPKTISAMENLIAEIEAMGHSEKALKIWEDTLSACQRTFGEEGSKTLDVMRRFSDSLDRAKRYNEARKIRESLLEIYQRQKDDAMARGDAKVAEDAMENIESLLSTLGRPAQALDMVRSIFWLRRERFGEDSKLAEYTAERLAGLLHERKKYAEELLIRKQIIAWMEREYGREACLTVRAMLEASIPMLKLGKNEEALAIAKEIHDIRKTNLGEAHWDTLLARHSIACILAKSDAYEDALAFEEETMRLLQDKKSVSYADASCVLFLCQMLEVISHCGMESSDLHKMTLDLFRELHGRYLRQRGRCGDEEACCWYWKPEHILFLMDKLAKELRKGEHGKEADILAQQGRKLQRIMRGERWGGQSKKR